MVNFPTVTCNLAFQRPPFRRLLSKKKKWHANKCKHLTESLSLSLFLLSTMKRSVCRTGPRADVNTAPNYKSHSKRAMLCCPVAPSTKAQPSYPNTSRCSAGNIWGSYSRLTTEAEELQWLWVSEACWEGSARSFLLSDTGCYFIIPKWSPFPHQPLQTWTCYLCLKVVSKLSLSGGEHGCDPCRSTPVEGRANVVDFCDSDSTPPCLTAPISFAPRMSAGHLIHTNTHIRMLWNGRIGQFHIIKCCFIILLLDN